MNFLSPTEKEWLTGYKKDIQTNYPGLLRKMILFGSKARGDFHPDSDLDLIVIIEDGDWKLKKSIRYLAYDTAIEENIMPSIIVYTYKEYQFQKGVESAFLEVVEDEGVLVK